MKVYHDIIQDNKLVPPPDDLWYRFSPTRLKDFDGCFRYGLFKYIMGINSKKPGIALVFGDAYHIGQKHMAINEYTKDSLEHAKILFTKRFRQDFVPESDSYNEPRTPYYGHIGLELFYQQFGNLPDLYETLAVEIADKVPITEDIFMDFKLDLVLKDRQTGEVLPCDHKTSKSSAAVFTTVMQRSSQFMTYLHAAKTYFGKDSVSRFMVYRFLTQKSKQNLSPIPLYFANEAIAIWHFETVTKIRSILNNIKALERQWEDPLLRCFSGRESYCPAYFSLCPYFHYCIGYPNPLQSPIWHDPEFEVYFWDAHGEEEE